jgi:hypothetical protein
LRHWSKPIDESSIFGGAMHDRQIRKRGRASRLEDADDGVRVAGVRCA